MMIVVIDCPSESLVCIQTPPSNKDARILFVHHQGLLGVRLSQMVRLVPDAFSDFHDRILPERRG